jgi:hypothetical protein
MANLPTGGSLAKGNKRNNRAKAQVDGRFNSEFSAGQGMANDRQHPTDTHKKGQHHTTDDGTRA